MTIGTQNTATGGNALFNNTSGREQHSGRNGLSALFSNETAGSTATQAFGD